MFDFSPHRLHMVWGRFAPRRPRHPIVRLLLGLIGAAVLALLVVFGLFVGVAMLALTAGWKLWRSLSAQPQPQRHSVDTAASATIDGEYAIVVKPREPLAHP
jgi:hypothetical protein